MSDSKEQKPHDPDEQLLISEPKPLKPGQQILND